MSAYAMPRGEPTALVARVLFRSMTLYAIVSTFISGLEALIVIAADRSETMLFTAPEYIQYLGLALGILFMVALAYYFKYVEYQKHHPEAKIQFEVRYVVAAVCTMLVAAIVAYVIQFFGLSYIAPETTIGEGALAFIVALFVGGAVTYIVDAVIFHPIVDGSAAMVFNKAQDKLREELASKEAKEKILAAVTEKARTLGLVDEAKIAALAKMVDDENDPSFALYVQLLLK